MIVLLSTYQKLERKYEDMSDKYQRLLGKWNRLVTHINRKGGQEFLQSTAKVQFTSDEIKKLISLCHPDRHQGSKIAGEMTVKLLKMRDENQR